VTCRITPEVKEIDMAKTKFDIKTEATRPLYVGVGVTDLAVEAVRDYVADVQKRFVDVQKTVSGIELQPQKLRVQASHVVSSRVDALSKDAKARRAAIEGRVAELQSEAQALVTDGVETVTGTYTDLAKRGESLVSRIRRQESTQATKRSAKTTTAKAKTTRTQGASTTKSAAKKTSAGAKSTARSTASSAKTTATTATTGAKKTARKATTTAKKSSAPSSAKATTTAAKKTASNATTAVADATKKVGD
jgi:predicted  nucleic acid-binding Zn-ribbon protein